VKIRAAEAEARLILEREWVARHPVEWTEWVRILPLLAFSYDFASGETYDFPQFLFDVGSRPSSNHIIQQRDNTLPYGQGNLVWMKQRTTKADLRPVDSPYLTVDEAAAYCRRERKTILNHHCLGNIRSMPGTRPPLFRREELDEWLSSRRKSRKK